MNKKIVNLITKYQNRPREGKKPRCRFYPTCSQYGKECYERFNFFKASLLTFWRILRCNPLNKGGYNPAPERKVKLKQLDTDLYVLPGSINKHRLNLYYLRGTNSSVVINAGSSLKHYRQFIKALKKAHLPEPNYVIMTNSLWCHTFGFVASNAQGIASQKILAALINQKTNIKDLKNNYYDPYLTDCLKLEYKHQKITLKMPTTLVSDTYELELGNHHIVIENQNGPLQVTIDDTYFISDDLWGDTPLSTKPLILFGPNNI